MRKAILILAILFPVVMVFAQAPDTLWTKALTVHRGYCEGWQVIETSDSGLLIAGAYKPSLFASDVLLIKANSDGETLWTRIYGDTLEQLARSVKETSDHGLIIAGYTKSTEDGYKDMYIIKTDSLGDTLWTRKYGGAYDQEGRSVALTPDGGFIFAGWSDSLPGNEKVYVIKTDSLGNPIWERYYGEDLGQRAWSIINTSDGGYILAGWSKQYLDYYYYQSYILKIDAYGEEEWSRKYGNFTPDQEARSIIETSDGYVVAGDITFTDRSNCAVIMKINQNGDRLWAHLLGISYTMANSVTKTRSGGFVACGYGYDGGFMAFVVKIDSLGEREWLRTFQAPEYYDYYARSIIQTSDNCYVFAGTRSPSAFPFVLLAKIGSDENLDIIEPGISRPSSISLSPAYPNPFNAQTTIRYSLPKASNVSIDIFDITGRKIETLQSGIQPAGEHSVVWNAEDGPSGIYFYRLWANGVSKTEKCIILK